MLALLPAVLYACGRASEGDADATREARRLAAGLVRSATPAAVLDSLEALHAAHPGARTIRDILRASLVAQQDWEGLVGLLTEPDLGELDGAESLDLARAYVALGRFGDAVRLLGPMAEARPNDLDVNHLAARASYALGDYDVAARTLDRVWNDVVSAKRIDAMMMRGMIFYYEGDATRAIEVLERTIAIRPSYVPASNALSRIHAERGEVREAELYRALAESTHAQRTAIEGRQMRLASRVHDLEDAFRAGRYDDCVRFAEDLLQSADEAQKPALYQWLGRAHKAAGRADAARAAFETAARLHKAMGRP